MAAKILNIGFNNVVLLDKVVATIGAGTLPSKRLIEEARRTNRLIDATCGRKTRTIIITDSNHIILSGIQPQTIIERIRHER